MSMVMDNHRRSWLPEQSLYIPIPRGPFYLLSVAIGLAVTVAFLGFFCAGGEKSA